MREGVIFAFQALLTAIGLVRMWSAVHWRHKALWAGYLGLIGFGDVSFWFFNYSAWAPLKTPYTYFFLTMCPYLLGNIFGIAYLLISGAKRERGAPRPAEHVPSLLIMAVSCRFVVIPMATKVLANGLDVSLASMILKFALSVAAIIVCLRAFLVEEERWLLACAMGLLIQSLVSWGINIEYIASGSARFTTLDIVWFAGVFLSVLPTLLWAEKDRTAPPVRTGDELSCKVRYWLMLLVLVPLTLLSLLQALDPKSASVVSLAILGGIGFVWFASEVLMDRIRSSTELKMLAASTQIAGQVAHDIRSPLAALEVLMRGANSLPEDERVLMRSATTRIKNIADGMLKINREALERASRYGSGFSGEFIPSDDPMENVSLRQALQSILDEKRLEYLEFTGIQFDEKFEQDPEPILVKFQPRELNRLLSNLINNSVESFESRAGTVGVVLAVQNGRPAIEIRDNGKGIEAENLRSLGLPGRSFGKEQGSGLGLFHAMQTMKFCGGCLEVESKIGLGTNVKLTFLAAL